MSRPAMLLLVAQSSVLLRCTSRPSGRTPPTLSPLKRAAPSESRPGCQTRTSGLCVGTRTGRGRCIHLIASDTWQRRATESLRLRRRARGSVSCWESGGTRIRRRATMKTPEDSQNLLLPDVSSSSSDKASCLVRRSLQNMVILRRKRRREEEVMT